MKDLIAALTIFAKYQDHTYPTHCEHDVLTVVGVTLEEVSEEDRVELDALGFLWSEAEGGGWISFRYGSA